MSIDASSFLTTPTTDSRKPAPTRHVQPRENPVDPAEANTHFRFDAPGLDLLSLYVGDENNKFPWQIIGGDSGEVDFLENITLVIGFQGNYRDAFYVRCRLEKSKDQDGRFQAIRVIERKFSESGEPIFEGAYMSLWRFLETHEPDPTWMNKTEWTALKKGIAPAMAEDKKRELGDVEARNVQAEQRQQAHAANQNPQGFMADALSSGIASALLNLGVTPKSQAAK